MADELIRTEVDHIIRALKRKRQLELSQLSAEAGMPAKEVESWVHVLEDNGMVRIDYKFTKIYVTWVGGGTLEIEDMRAEAGKGAAVPHEELEEQKEKTALLKGKPAGKKQEEKVKIIIKKEVSPKLKQVQEIKPADAVKPAEAKKSEKPKTAPIAPIVPIMKEDAVFAKEIKTGPAKPAKIEAPAKEPEKIVLKHAEKASREIAKREKAFAQISDRLRERIAQINQKNFEIAEMKKEKQQLFEEGYKPVERRFEAEIETIRDVLLSKERRIVELQEKALSIPDKASGIEEGVLKLRELEKEAKKVLDDSTILVEETLNELREVSQDAEAKLDSARQDMYSKVEKLGELDSLLERVRHSEEDVGAKVAEARERLEKEQANIESLEEEMGEVRNAKEGVQAALREVKQIVDSEASRLLDIEGALARINRVDAWVRENQSQFRQKLEEFADYAKESENEYLNLREAVETGFVRKYLRELREVTDSHEFEIAEVARVERGIDEKIEDSKKQLRLLIDESRALAEKYEGIVRRKESRTKIGEEVGALKQRGEEIEAGLETIKEKRERLIEEIEDTIEARERMQPSPKKKK